MVLDNLLGIVASNASAAMGSISGLVQTTFFLIIAIDFVLAVLLNLGDTDHIKQLISKILRYGFFLWLIGNWGMLLNAVVNSLSEAGSTMGGYSIGALQHPSEIINNGMAMAEPFFNYITGEQFTSMTGFFGSMGLWFLGLIGGCGIWLAFAILALQCFITYVEFYIASALVLIFIPWGVNKHTSFVAEKAIGAVISFGTKLMILSAILGLSYPLINESMYHFDGNPTWDGILGALVGPWALTFLAWQAPAMAAGIMTGAPSLSAGTVAGAAMAGAAGGAAGSTLASGLAHATGAAAGAGLRGASSLAGAAVGGAQKAAATSNLGAAAGGMKGMGNFAGAKVKGAYNSATQGMRDSYGSAKEAGFGSSSSSSGSSDQGGSDTGNFNSGSAGNGSARESASGSDDNTIHGDGFTMSSGSDSGGNSQSSGSRFSNSSNSSTASSSGAGQNSSSFEGVKKKSDSAAASGSTSTNSSAGYAEARSGYGDRFDKFMSEAQRAIPPEGAPEGGMSAPIRSDD
ncbi:type IV secretion system protein [Phascolarctobacterium sp.]